MITLYLAGYSGRRPKELKEAAKALNALVVDTRLRPFSRRPEWRRPALMALLQEDYCWIPDFGNLNYRGGPIQIRNMAQGLETMAASAGCRPVILLCVCADVRQCHRLVVADSICWDHMAAVRELDWAQPQQSPRISTYRLLHGESGHLLEGRPADPASVMPRPVVIGQPAVVIGQPDDDLPRRTFAARTRR